MHLNLLYQKLFDSWSRKYTPPYFSPQHQTQYELLYLRAMQNTGALASWFCIRLSIPHSRRGPRVGCSSGSLARVSWYVFQLCIFSLSFVASLQLEQEWAPPRTETNGSMLASFKSSFMQAIHSCKPSLKGDCLLEREGICIKLFLGALLLFTFWCFEMQFFRGQCECETIFHAGMMLCDVWRSCLLLLACYL